jgi:hypothetical protein
MEFEDPSAPPRATGLDALSVKQLKAIASAYNISLEGCTERGEIIAMLKAKGVNSDTVDVDGDPYPNSKQSRGASGSSANAGNDGSGGGRTENGADKRTEKDNDSKEPKGLKDMKLQSERAARIFQENVRRFEPKEVFFSVCF